MRFLATFRRSRTPKRGARPSPNGPAVSPAIAVLTALIDEQVARTLPLARKTSGALDHLADVIADQQALAALCPCRLARLQRRHRRALRMAAAVAHAWDEVMDNVAALVGEGHRRGLGRNVDDLVQQLQQVREEVQEVKRQLEEVDAFLGMAPAQVLF